MTRTGSKSALQPRKTPAQARSSATVAAVVEAAARILETQGPHAYTTNAVAERAGVSVGSLYQYFPGKDAVTRALIDRETEALAAEIAAIDPGAGGRGALEALMDAAARHQLRRPALARVLDEEEARLPLTEERHAVGARFARVLQACLDAPDLTASAPGPNAAADLLALIKGMVDAAGARGESDAVDLASRVRRAVFGYLEYAPPVALEYPDGGSASPTGGQPP